MSEKTAAPVSSPMITPVVSVRSRVHGRDGGVTAPSRRRGAGVRRAALVDHDLGLGRGALLRLHPQRGLPREGAEQLPTARTPPPRGGPVVGSAGSREDCVRSGGLPRGVGPRCTGRHPTRPARAAPGYPARSRATPAAPVTAL